MSKPLILPVGYVYIGKNGIVSTYPQGNGLDLAVTSSEALKKPENLGTLREMIAEGGAMYNAETLKKEADPVVTARSLKTLGQLHPLLDTVTAMEKELSKTKNLQRRDPHHFHDIKAIGVDLGQSLGVGA